MARRIKRRPFDMAIRTDARRRSFTGKELCAMATETSLVLRILRHIRKSVLALPDLFPVLRGKLVTRIAGKLLFDDMGFMRHRRVVDSGWRIRALADSGSTALPPLLPMTWAHRQNRSHQHNQNKQQ